MRCNDSLKLLDVKVASDAVSLTLEQTFSRITGKIYKGVFFRYGVLQCSLPICSIASAPSTPSSPQSVGFFLNLLGIVIGKNSLQILQGFCIFAKGKHLKKMNLSRI